MSHIRIPRKQKKQMRKAHCFFIDKWLPMRYNWHFKKHMVITRNMVLSGMDIDITPERLGWIKDGLLLDGWGFKL